MVKKEIILDCNEVVNVMSKFKGKLVYINHFQLLNPFDIKIDCFWTVPFLYQYQICMWYNKDALINTTLHMFWYIGIAQEELYRCYYNKPCGALNHYKVLWCYPNFLLWWAEVLLGKGLLMVVQPILSMWALFAYRNPNWRQTPPL